LYWYGGAPRPEALTAQRSAQAGLWDAFLNRTLGPED